MGTKTELNMTAAAVRQEFIYDPETGVFVWREAHGLFGQYCAGQRIGYVGPTGYVMISITRNRIRKRYRAHQLAWLYMTGEWPSQIIDHINGDKTDNRFANLRLANKAQNAMNMRKVGKRGVYQISNGRWRAVLAKRHIGYFDTLAEAQAAFDAAAKRVHGDYYRPVETCSA